MSQIDWIGGGDLRAQKPFKDIRNQRASTAEQKAERLLILGRLLNRVPEAVKNGSVQAVRSWQDARSLAAKISKSPRSSLHDIESAISKMRAFERGSHE